MSYGAHNNNCFGRTGTQDDRPYQIATGYAGLLDFIECFMTNFLHTHSWLNWVDEDNDERH